MRQTARRDAFETFLTGEVMLVALLAATLALFLTKAGLRSPYDLPRLRLVLWVLYAVGGGLIALLTATRFTVEGRRYDLLICAGFTLISVSWVVFAIGPEIDARPVNAAESWPALAGTLAGWTVLAAAPFARGTTERRRPTLAHAAVAAALGLLGLWVATRVAGLPVLAPTRRGTVPALRSGALAALALVNLLAVVGFAGRYRRHSEDLDRWLALGATLTLFASLDSLFEPVVAVRFVTQGDFLRLLAYGVLVVGVWRAIHASAVGWAIGEERARVAREIHDGLSQYLFAASTHAAMLQAAGEQADRLAKLKAAVQAAQTEARFATLALSSAAGRAPFDAALRRYVDILTADGALAVELDIDGSVRLAPDEQIEVFRIVQEGLANARKHAQAARAWVEIGRRGADRLVLVRDDGSGFEPSEDAAAQGLRNIRQRVAAIGGAFSLRTGPGLGTALEIVLRP
jgi:signal transduction histidine kinase